MGTSKISVVLDSDQVGRLDDLVGDSYDNRSEAVREVLSRGFEYDSLAAERDDLRRQLSAANARYEDHKELVEYVEEERSLRKQQAEAPIWRRAKWWVFGQ